tara:strand:+ start:605 stop:892 length:288 start_codon:yes stop_codon:yes gene_type:complete
MLNTQEALEQTEGISYLGNIALSKQQVQGIIAQYLGTNNAELKDVISDAEQDQKDVRFKTIWLTDENFCEVHFTAVTEETQEENSSETEEVTTEE